jgi:hypothetical protein
MFKGIYWKGRGLVIPGAYASVNADAMAPNRLSPANTIAAIGVCHGGKPQEAIRVTSLREAMNLLRGGDLKTAAELMYDPSSDVPGAGEVVFIRVNSAIQATGAISTQLGLTSDDYGAHTCFIRHKVENGTSAGKKITVNHQADDVTEIGDNLGPLLNLEHVNGSFIGARYSYDRSTNKFLVETSVDGTTAWTELVEYDTRVSPTDTIKGLASALDAHPDLVCTVSKYGDGTIPSDCLDTVTSVDLKDGVVTLTSEVGAVKQWLNLVCTLINAVNGSVPTGNITSYNWSNLTGGTEGAVVTNQDWTDALAKLETESDIKLVYVATDVEAIHLSALSHCNQMSDIKVGKERMLICGGASNESVEQSTTRAVNQGDKRSVLVYPGVKRVNSVTGALDSLAPSLAAAIVCGMAAGVAPEIPLTYKTIRVQGMEKYLTDTELETLLNQGVCPLRFLKSDGIYEVVQSITTYQKDANVIYRKLSGMRIHDYIRQELRNTSRRFIGQVADVTTIVAIKNAIISKLDSLTRGPQNTSGVLTQTLQNGVVTPSYKNLVVNFDGFDWVQISVDVHPVGEVAYITIDATLKPAAISA